MVRFYFFVLIPLAVYRDGCYGNQAISGLEGLSDADYPDSDIPVKRNLYQLGRSSDAVNWSDHPNICFLTHEGQSEGQISCRLRFARSNFNFNPFGLRFGKRELSDIITKRVPVSSSDRFLPYLLHLRARQMAACGETSGERC